MDIESKPLGSTGLMVSAIGFGCGAVGGLMVRGEAADQERAVARALELGITYFDTAPSYGHGQSETNLGRVLRRLKPRLVLGTKVNLPPGPPAAMAAAIAASLEASLTRLGTESVDLFQLHDQMTDAGGLHPQAVHDHVLPALERLRTQGKFRHSGFTAIGDTGALHRVLAEAGMACAQVPFNLLNPSAARVVPPGFPGQDYAGLVTAAASGGKGVIAIRVLAGGALSGTAARHPLAATHVEPIGSGVDYAADVRRAGALQAVARDAGADNTVTLAIRYAISQPGISTALVGLANLEQLEFAASAAMQGPLPADILTRVAAVQDGFAG